MTEGRGEWWWRKHIAREIELAVAAADLHPADSRLVLDFVDQVVLKDKKTQTA